jgi:GDP-4-dehydro-6-deoxy-D-mannose reductase
MPRPSTFQVRNTHYNRIKRTFQFPHNFKHRKKRMRVLVLGATGFVGSYLMEHHLAQGDAVMGTDYLPTIAESDMVRYRHLLRRADIRYTDQIASVMHECNPELVYHLSAQSYPALSWKAPAETLDTNVKGTSNVFEAMKLVGIKPRTVVACSSAQYGLVPAEAVPIDESYPMRPLHPYGVSKLATEALAVQYFENDKIPAVCARIFNTTGPRKRGDVCADFTRRLVAAERGIGPKELRVGNLTTLRALTDVRDLMTALILLAQKGRPGQAYNISGAKTYQMSTVLDTVLSHRKVDVNVVQAPELMRPSDEPVIFGNSAKLVADTGWKQSVTLEQTLSDMLAYWRKSEDGALA